VATYVYIYVGEEAARNFRVGMDSLTWGWRSPSAGPLAATASRWLEHPGASTYLAFAQGVHPANAVPGWPRTPDRDMSAWLTATVDRLTFAQLVGAMYQSQIPLWNDDIYPYRVRFRSVTQQSNVQATQLNEDAVRAIRDSTVRQGRPILGPEPFKAGAVVVEDVDDQDAAPDRLLNGLDGLDGIVLALVRREQQQLRRNRFGTRAHIACAICGRDLPVGFVRLAHIKRRADANDRERLMPANTMPACTLGCDELFERGYITVDETGVIHAAEGLDSTPDLSWAIDKLQGRMVLDYSAVQDVFFAWHRERHAGRRKTAGRPSDNVATG
jgi:hypothetical protein